MDTKLLKIFLKICETQNFTQTAKQLNYAQSTVSEAMQNLELQLNQQLFERLSKKVQLTRHGEMLVPYAKNICTLVEELETQMKELTHQNISIGITESLGAYKFPDFFKNFITAFENIEINFITARCEEMPDLIRSNIIDIGFTLDDHIIYKDINNISLFKEEIVFLFGSKDIGSSLSLSNLSGVTPIISQGQTGYNKLFYDICREASVEIGRPVFMENLEAIKAYVKGGFGYAFLPMTTAEKEVKSNELRIVDTNGVHYYQEVQLLIHKNKTISSHLKTLIDYATNQLML